MPKIVVVNDSIGIDVYDKWSHVEKNHSLTKADFVKEGDDFLCILDKESYLVSKDIKLLESLATERVFGKKKVDWTTVIAVIITNFIVLTFFIGG